MYNRIYKCKLCEKIVLEAVYERTDRNINIRLINDNIYEKQRIHFCSDKEMGVLEVIGFRKE